MMFGAPRCAPAITRLHAGVAQLVEQLIRNQQVLGSSPSAGSTESMATGGVCQSAGCCDVTSHIDIFVSSGRDSTRD